MITILLPTNNRPEMLRTALRSIASQTALDRITEVIVSESKANERSIAVCAEFGDVPVKYVTRDPSIEHLLLLPSLVGQVKTPYTAILHDDDWWADGHLASALAKFSAHSEICAYWGSCFNVSSEVSALMVWLNGWICCGWASGFRSVCKSWILSSTEAAFGCLPATPAHFSSLVASSKVLHVASELVGETRNPFDTDRHLFLELGKAGSVCINPVPEVFVRTHSSQDAKRFSSENVRHHMQLTTEKILDYLEGEGIALKVELERRLSSVPPEFLTPLIQAFCPAALKCLEARDALPEVLRPPVAAGSFRKVKKFVSFWTPPAFHAGYRKISTALRPKKVALSSGTAS